MCGAAALVLLVVIDACAQAPRNGWILFDSERASVTGDQSIYLMAPDGSNVRRLAHVEGITSWLADWSPDRKRIVFSSNRTGPWDDLYVMDADGANVRQLTDTPEASEHDAAWSPDGRQIAYDRAEIVANRTRQNAQLWIVDSAGSNARPLTSGRSRNLRPAWSPDGSTIAFMSDRHAAFDPRFAGTDDGDLEIYVMKTDGSNKRRLTNCAGTASSPAWSPDSQRVAFACGGGNVPPQERGLHVMNADGTDERRLATGFGFRPAWSPDGQTIAYNCNPSSQALQFDQFEICTIGADGSRFRTLTNNKVFDGHPDWR